MCVARHSVQFRLTRVHNHSIFIERFGQLTFTAVMRACSHTPSGWCYLALMCTSAAHNTSYTYFPHLYMQYSRPIYASHVPFSRRFLHHDMHLVEFMQALWSVTISPRSSCSVRLRSRCDWRRCCRRHDCTAVCDRRCEKQQRNVATNGRTVPHHIVPRLGGMDRNLRRG